MSNSFNHPQSQATNPLLKAAGENMGFGGSQYNAETTEDSQSEMDENAAKGNTQLSNSEDTSAEKKPNPRS